MKTWTFCSPVSDIVTLACEDRCNLKKSCISLSHVANSDRLQEEQFLHDICGRKHGLMVKPEAIIGPALV